MPTSERLAAPRFRPPEVVCPVCGAADELQGVRFHKEGARFVQCGACTFEFVNPRPTAEWLDARYADYGAHYFTDAAKAASDFAPGRFATELRLLKGKRECLLDVGCATGAFVAAAQDAGFDACGMDVSAESTAYGRKELGLRLDVGDPTRLIYADGSFDVVTLWATLEHLPDPSLFLHEARRVLRPGGVLVFSVPNHAGISQRLLSERNRYVGIDHVNYFTAHTAAVLLRRHDFIVLRTLTDKANPIVMWQDWRGRTPDGASIGQQLADQQVTNRVKQGNGLSAAMRVGHRIAVACLRSLGLGDILYVMARWGERPQQHA